MDSIEINKKYRQKIKLEKLEEKKKLDIKKTIRKRREYRYKKTAEQQEKIKTVIYAKMLKDIAKKTKQKEDKRNKEIKNLKREIKWNKKVEYKKKDKTLAWYKKHSQSDYQWCVRYDAKDENGYVKTIDWKVRKWNDCDAGHIFSKSKYPHMIFYKDNCYPQSKRSNKELWQASWLIEFKSEIIARIWKKRYHDLVNLSTNNIERNKLRNKQYRKDKYKYWHKKRILREKKL